MIKDAEKLAAYRRAYNKAYRQKHRERLLAEDRERYRRDPKRKIALRQRRLKKVGWSDADVHKALQSQNGRCALCEVTLTEGRGPSGMAADHDHETGLKRALLCNRCNVLEGLHLDVPIDEEEWGRRVKQYRSYFRS